MKRQVRFRSRQSSPVITKHYVNDPSYIHREKKIESVWISKRVPRNTLEARRIVVNVTCIQTASLAGEQWQALNRIVRTKERSMENIESVGQSVLSRRIPLCHHQNFMKGIELDVWMEFGCADEEKERIVQPRPPVLKRDSQSDSACGYSIIKDLQVGRHTRFTFAGLKTYCSLCIAYRCGVPPPASHLLLFVLSC